MDESQVESTPSGVVSVVPEVGELPKDIERDIMGYTPPPTVYSALRDALVHINLGDNPDIRPIAWSLYFVDKRFVDIHGIKALASVFKCCAIVDFSTSAVLRKTYFTEDEFEELQSLFANCYVVVPIKGVRVNKGKYSWDHTSSIKFGGMNLRNFEQNALFRSCDYVNNLIKGLIIFGRVVKMGQRSCVTACVPRIFVQDYTTIEANMQSEIINILEQV